MTSVNEKQNEHRAKVMALMALDEGHLSGDGRRILLTHLRKCEVCRDELAHIRALRDVAHETHEVGNAPDWEKHDWSASERRLLALVIPAANNEKDTRDVAVLPKASPVVTASPMTAKKHAQQRWTRPVTIGAVLAAAATLLWFNREPPVSTPIAHNTPSTSAATTFVPPSIEMRTTLVAGRVERAGLAEQVGMPLRPGTRMRLTPAARHDVALASEIDSDALMVSVEGGGEGAEWGIASPTTDALLHAELLQGKMTAKVDVAKVADVLHSSNPAENQWVRAAHLVVNAQGHTIESTTGHFEARVLGDAVSVRVARGTVRVTTPDGSVHEIVAPGAWRSNGEMLADDPPLVDPTAFALSSLRLALPDVVRWEVDGASFSQPTLQLAHVPGVVRVQGWDARGQVYTAELQLEGMHELREGELAVERPREMQGTIPPDQIASVVRASLPRLRRCYELGLRQRPTLTGNLTAEVTVDLEGRVANIEIDEANGASALTSCVRAEAARWSFPPPVGGRVRFALPLRFEAER